MRFSNSRVCSAEKLPALVMGSIRSPIQVEALRLLQGSLVHAVETKMDRRGPVREMSAIDMHIQPVTVSVILPTYNRRHTIRRAIASVLGQTLEDYEMLVIDDGSTDGTADLMRTFKDPRVRYVRRYQNCGASAARNVGLDLARGKYIAFLDSDDEWLPESLERRLTVLESSVLESPGGVASGFMYVTDGKPTRYCSPPGGLEDLMGLNVAVAPQTWLLKREVIDAGYRFDETLKAFVDWDFLLRLSLRYDLETIPDPLALVHHAPNIKRVWSNTNITTSLRALETKHEEIFTGWPGARSRFFKSAASYSYSARSLPETRRYLWRAIRARRTDPEPYFGLLATLGGSRFFGAYLKARRSVKNVAVGRRRQPVSSI